MGPLATALPVDSVTSHPKNKKEQNKSEYMYVCVCVYINIYISAPSWSRVQRNPTDFGVCVCVWSRNLENEAMAPVWPQRQRKKYMYIANIHIPAYVPS